MDSINRNQKEENHQDLFGKGAADKIRELVEKSGSCFLCTQNPAGESLGVRPMSVLQVDDEGALWFLSASDSHKNEEIKIDPEVKLFFQGSAHGDFLHIIGRAYLSADKEKIKELWEPVMKVWFTEGENDSRISVIRVNPEEGYYWNTKHGAVVATAKMLFGALTGKTFDDSMEGRVSL